MPTAKIDGHVKSAVSLVSFYLPKLHLAFELFFLPKMYKILSVLHMTQPRHRFTKYFTCQVFNRMTECDCVWRIP